MKHAARKSGRGEAPGEAVYRERFRIVKAVYHRIVLPDDFLPYTCAGSSAVLQGVLRHFGHHVHRTGVTPVEEGPGGPQVHVVAYDDRYVYDLTYTQFRRLRVFGSPIIPRKDFETRFLLLPTLFDPLMCTEDFYRAYLPRLGAFDPRSFSLEDLEEDALQGIDPDSVLFAGEND